MKRLSMKALMKVMWMLALASAVTFTACNKDDDDDDDKPVIILDGLYVKGDATAYADFNDDARMAITRNEVNQTDRPSLYELYIPIRATGGFNIVMVEGSTRKTYGPGGDFAVVTNPTTDEPKVDFWRGTYQETETKFTVPADGMYHVVIDTELGKCVIVPVHWGVIGAATPNGWGGSTELTESAFDSKSMSWSVQNFELRGGDWKFRYSDGWKVELDTTLDIGGGNIGVKVNTNLGEAVDNLVPGGANIVNSAPGVYSITLAYTLGDGYTATVTKTGDLPLTNWTGVECDAVGTGVSIDNPTATPDPSGWGWGNVVVADNGGVPTQAGDVYTWTWTSIILEANEGFKLRTLNGVAPPSGGANFDVGYSAINTANSTSNLVDDGSGNIVVSTKATYNITLTIDAANNDVKEITITD